MVLKNRNHSVLNQSVYILAILAAGFFLLAPTVLHSQGNGFKYFKNFTPKEYNHNAQNWDIAQTQNGIIYVANQAGLLEYDGVSWRVIYIGESPTARSLAIAGDGAIYVGGQNEIGYLTPDEKGTLQYESLTHLLEEKYRNFGNVWSTHITQKGVYYRATHFIFRLRGSREKIINVRTTETSNKIRAAFVCNGELWVLIHKEGLHKLVNGSLQLLPGIETPDISLKNVRIGLLEPYDETAEGHTLNWLIGVRGKGFFLYDGKTMKVFPVENEDFVLSNVLYSGTRLSNGEYALATRHGGLFIMDRHGRITSHYDQTSGLQNHNVKKAFEDVQGNLWLCLDSGISRIEYLSPFSVFDERSGLPGLVLSVVREGNTLYAGTTSGLYYREDANEFSKVPGIFGICFSLVSKDGSIFAASTNGIYNIKNGITRNVIAGPSYSLLVSTHFPGRTWCGRAGELVAVDKENGQLTLGLRVDTENQQIRSLTEDIDGNLWLGTMAGILYNVQFDAGGKPPTVARYDSSHGLPKGEITVAQIVGKVMFATPEGLFGFNPEEKEKKFSLSPLVYKLNNDVDLTSKPVFRIVEDKRKNIWLYSEGRVYRLIPSSSGSYEITFRPFRRIPTTAQLNHFYPDPDNKTIWLATHEGLIQYDPLVKRKYKKDFYTLVRKVIINGKLTYDGFKYDKDNQSATVIPEIDFGNRKNIRIEFASPFFEVESETRYSYFLEGFDDGWSEWSTETSKEYTILDSGQYTFRVRARNIYVHIGKEDHFPYGILPPWYKTWWAYILYIAAFILLVFLIVKWRFRYLEREKEKLELTIKERTKEIGEKNQQLEHQTGQLRDQSEKLKEMDKVKSRFFANISHEFRTPLTLIMSPLEMMLSRHRDKKEKKTLNVMLRNTQRLLTLINQLLDLSRIDSGKIKMQVARHNIVSFLKGAVASFELLSEEKGLDLDFQTGDDEIYLYFNGPKMEEVMYNLMINAFKFTPPGGKITVSVSTVHVSPGGDVVEISVKDTGMGITQEELVRIFDRFYQAGGFEGKGHKGTGIGLALAKEIIQLHHGTIDVHSQEGEGTEFVFRLPMGSGHFVPEEIAATNGEPTGSAKKKEFDSLFPNGEEDDEEVPAEPLGEENDKTREPGKPVILVVEDNADVRYYIREPLEQENFIVVEAADGVEGIEKAKELVPDLIVSDIMMPKIEGTDLCRKLKEDIDTCHIPIILLTAKASEDSIVEGLATGADDYITKPFSSRILLTRIKNLIDLRVELQNNFKRQNLNIPSKFKISSLDEQLLTKFKTIIMENLRNEDFNIDMLCDKLEMKRASLFKKIKALTGETPNHFLLFNRLELARKLLKENFGNVTEVAMEAGFGSATYFAKCFKEQYDMSPSSYQASEAIPSKS
jgi:signal transduction histidine kinase/DNA-binding NarL/FixJ family response regulator/ligand-binding sensor domain-containing protein